MKKLYSIAAVTAMGLSLGVGGLVVDAAPAQAAGNYARCTNGITTRDWTGKNPKDCTPSGTYWLYNSAGTPLVKISQASRTSPVWEAIKTGYTAAQNWCSNNSLTCGIITSAGVVVVAGLI